MLREEADREAERRNREDADRERFEFYAFDESAGMAPDAWDVAARLRQGPQTDRPATAAAAARQAPPAPAEETVAYEAVVDDAPNEAPVYEEPAYEDPAHQAPAYEEVAYGEAAYGEAAYGEAAYGEAAHGEAAYGEAEYGEAAYPEYAGAPVEDRYAEPVRRRLRLPRRRPRRERDPDEPGLIVRTVGAVVIAVGMLWMALVATLAWLLKPEDATSFAVYIAGAVLGLLAIALGVAIRRS